MIKEEAARKAANTNEFSLGFITEVNDQGEKQPTRYGMTGLIHEVLTNCVKQTKGSKLNVNWAADQVAEIFDHKFKMQNSRISK